MFLDFWANLLLNRGRYQTNSESVIISCFYNPQNSPYRLLAFQKWYHSIKHLNHRIVECVIGNAKPQLPESPYISRVQSDSLLWHKETLLNGLIPDLPEKFKYVFWVDADVLFTNQNWLVEATEELARGANVVQPFSYCIHLDCNQLEPNFDVDSVRGDCSDPAKRHKRVWRSFCANYVMSRQGNRRGYDLSADENYDRHGHVGFAWGARREVLEKCPLYDRALIGGADHIIAHAAAGHIPHKCITKSFTENIAEVEAWSKKFYSVVQGRIGCVPGDLYHIWHGDIEKRQYLKRIKDFTPTTKGITKRDKNGLHVQPGNQYIRQYFRDREVFYNEFDGFGGFDEGFAEDMGYALEELFYLLSQQPDGPYYDGPVEEGYVPELPVEPLSAVDQQRAILEQQFPESPAVQHQRDILEQQFPTQVESENFS